MRPNSDDGLTEEEIAVIHELILRGLRDVPVHEREYGEAYDRFCDVAGVPLTIGEQPERVREVWDEVFEDAA